MSQGKINFFLTGSIACYKACDVISQLRQQKLDIQAIATSSALRFVGASTLEGLTGRPVMTDIFESEKAMQHIDLARWADLNLVCPATANSLNHLAAGLGDDVLGCLFLASNFSKPWWVAPAMNHQMWLHPATQQSVGKLKEWGVKVMGPEEGSLACGEQGPGRLIEPAKLVSHVTGFFAEGRA